MIIAKKEEFFFEEKNCKRWNKWCVFFRFPHNITLSVLDFLENKAFSFLETCISVAFDRRMFKEEKEEIEENKERERGKK